MAPEDSAPPAIDLTHNARTDSPAVGWLLHLEECPSHAEPTARPPLALALSASARCRERSTPPPSIDTPATATLGSLEHLLHARAVVDALLGRLAPVTREDGISTATKESTSARKQSKPLRSSPRRNLPLGNPQRGKQKPRHPDPGTTHRPRRSRQ